MRRFLLLAAALLLPAKVIAQPGVAPLSLDEVLRSSATHSPQIVEALARVRSAEGRELSAAGAFDTVFQGESRSRLSGYYDGSVVESRLSRPLSNNGGEAYAAYRLSRGAFPVYEDRNYTNRRGEVKIGATFALMRDRLIDERRARLGLAAADVDIARFEGELVAIGVQSRALQAYQAWVAAGLRLATYRSLLDLAVQRRSSIGRQVALGAQPRILETENEQNIVRRRALVVRTELELATAANTRSLYYRDANGTPIVPDSARLPDALPAIPRAPRTAGAMDLPDRPDFNTIMARIGQAEDRLMLAENELRPKVDVFAEGARDLGPIGLGGPSREGTDAIAGVRFSVPLQRRVARGKVAEVRAEIDALQSRRRMLVDQVTADVNAIVVAVDAAARLVTLASEEADLAERMAQAERRRFGLGASDFLIVNLREEAAADARIRLLDADYRLATARADYVSITVNREALRLPAL